MENSHPAQSGTLRWSGRVTAEEAFEQATLDLAMEGIHIDAEQVPPLVAYRDGTMTYDEAVEAMRERHRRD